MYYLETYGARGQHTQTILWALLIQSIIVVAIVSTLVLIGAYLKGRTGRFVIGRPMPVVPRGGTPALKWMYFGLVLTALALTGSVIWTMISMAAIGEPAAEPRFTIRLIGHQWWWEAQYIDPGDPSRGFETANELHIPVGEPVRLELTSVDVIHSFWVPALAGKTDLIPGRTNITWIEADKAGIYRGMCAEYCGQQHAHMAMRVFADAPEAFQAWWAAQLEPAANPTPAMAALK